MEVTAAVRERSPLRDGTHTEEVPLILQRSRPLSRGSGGGQVVDVRHDVGPVPGVVSYCTVFPLTTLSNVNSPSVVIGGTRPRPRPRPRLLSEHLLKLNNALRLFNTHKSAACVKHDLQCVF